MSIGPRCLVGHGPPRKNIRARVTYRGSSTLLRLFIHAQAGGRDLDRVIRHAVQGDVTRAGNRFPAPCVCTISRATARRQGGSGQVC